MSIVGERIKARRAELEMTQLALAYALGIAPSQIYRYERGENDPSSTVLLALSKALQTTPNYLLGVTDNPEAQISEITDSSPKVTIREPIDQEIDDVAAQVTDLLSRKPKAVKAAKRVASKPKSV